MLGESSSILASMNSWFTPTVLFVLLNVMIGTIFLSNQRSQPQDHKKAPQSDPKINRSPSVLHRLRSINLYTFRSQQESPIFTKQIPDSDAHFYQSLETSATPFVFNQTHEHPPNIQTHVEEEEEERETHFPVETEATHYVFNQTHQEQQDFNLTHDEERETYVEDEEEEEEEEIESEGEENDEVSQSLDEVYSQLTCRQVGRTTSDTKPASGEIPKKLPAKMKKSASLKSAFAHFEEEKIVVARRPATVRERKTARVTEEDDVEVDAKADDFINKFKQQLKLQRIESISNYKDMIGRGSAK